MKRHYHVSITSEITSEHKQLTMSTFRVIPGRYFDDTDVIP